MISTKQIDELINDPLTEVFVAKNFGFYKSKWEKFKENKQESWNWPAFFLGPIWAFYRKMKLLGLLYLLAMFAVDFFSAFIYELVGSSPSILFKWFCLLVIEVFFAVYANYFYFRFVKKKITKIKAEVTEDMQLDKVKRKGGTSVLVPIISMMMIVILTVLVIFISALFVAAAA